MTTFIVTRDPVGYDPLIDQPFKSRLRADIFLDMRRRAEEFARMICIEGEGGEPFEVAHVRNGILYEGMSSQVDWADLDQVVDIWERAKEEILNRLVAERGGTKGFESIVGDVIKSMGLPEQWRERLQKAVMKTHPEIESSLVLLVDEWPSIPSMPTEWTGNDEQNPT